MNVRKPAWLIIILAIALAAFQLGFKPIRMAKKPLADVITPLRLETEKPVVSPAQRTEEVKKHLEEVWHTATEDPEALSEVKIETDRLVRFEVIAVDKKEFEEYAEKITQELAKEFGKIARVEEEKEEEYAARAGPFAIYWPPKPQVRLGLDLRGGSRILLQMMPTTMWTFTNEEGSFFPADDPAAKGKLLEELKRGLEERGFRQVDLEAPDESKLRISVATSSEEEKDQAEAIVGGLMTARFPGAQKTKTVSATIEEKTAEGVIGVMENRVNGMGVAEATVQRQGLDRVVVSLPGLKDPAGGIAVLGKIAKLDFRHVPKKYEAEESEDGGLEFRDRDTKELVPNEQVLAASEYILGGKDLRNNATISTGDRGWEVSFQFKAGDPTRTFSNFTRKAARTREYLAIVLDGKIVSCPEVESHIPDQGRITGNFTLEEAKRLMNWLNAGALPVPLEVAERRTVSATLGADTVRKSLAAGLWGALVVLVFIMLYYRFCGLLADVALGIYCLLVLAVMVQVPVVLTLPGIAGLILSVGMAVDANVIIFERLKEELRAGRTLEAAIEAGFKRAWAAIFDCNFTTLLACFALYVFGTGAVKGFALTLSIGVICSFFSAVTVTKAFVHWAAKSRGLAESPLFTKR